MPSESSSGSMFGRYGAVHDDVDPLKALVIEQQARLAVNDTKIDYLKLLIAKLLRM